MTRAFAEYREIRVTEALRQGDVLEATDPLASMWCRHLVVITADCDFAFAKHHGRVTCVPVLAAHEYLMEMHVPRLRAKLVSKLVQAFRTILTPAVSMAISDERLREWPCEQQPEEVISALQLPAKDIAVAESVLDGIRILGKPSESLDDAIEFMIAALLKLPKPPKRENAIHQVLGTLRAPFSQPPGDAMFLSTFSRAHDNGYFVYLRHLEQVREVDIAIGPTRAAVSYRRISRLRDRYIHALVQRFAMVFMTIGLPTEYEDTRDVYAYLLGEGYE